MIAKSILCMFKILNELVKIPINDRLIPADKRTSGHNQSDKHIRANPANTKHLYSICTTSAQRLRRWTNIVQMLYKCFVFAGNTTLGQSSFWHRAIPDWNSFPAAAIEFKTVAAFKSQLVD